MNRLIILLSFTVLLFSACNKNNEPALAPVVDFVTDEGYIFKDTTLDMGAIYKIGIKAFGEDANITNLIIKVDDGEESFFLDSGMNTREFDYLKTIVKGPAISEKWTFIVRDRNGLSSEISNIISLDTSSIIYGEVVEFKNILLGAQDNSQNGFLSLIDGTTFSMEGAYHNQEIIDMCYYYDIIDTDENTISSPGGNISELIFPGEYWTGNWMIRRETRYKIAELSYDDFAAAQNDSLLLVAYGSSDGKRKAKNLKAGDIFSFKNQDGRVGLFYVNSVAGLQDGTIDISIKLQKQ